MAEPLVDQPAQETVRVFDASGRPLIVSPADAQDLLQSGQGYGMAAGDKIPVRLAGDSAVTMLDASEAVPLLEKRQASTAAFGAYQRQREEAEFGGIGGAIGGAATGLFKGATAGYGDAALVGLGSLVGKGAEVRRTLRGYETYSPIARGLGEAAGFVAPAVATLATGGGAGAAATGLRAATAGGRAVAAAGATTEALAARGLAAAGLAEGGVAARALASAAGQAVELGVYGSGEALSRAVVQRPELTGEQAVAAMGGGFIHGALAGAVGGALLGGGAAALRGGAQLGLEGATRLAEKVSGRTSAMAGGGVTEQAGKLLDTVLPGGLEKYAEEKAIKSLGGNQPGMRSVSRMADEYKAEMAKMAVEEAPVVLKMKPGQVLSHTQQAEAFGLIKKAVGTEKRALIEEASATGFRADLRTVTSNLRKGAEHLEKSVLSEDIAAYRKVMKTIDRIEDKLSHRGATGRFQRGATLDEIWQQQQAIGKAVKWDLIRKGEASVLQKEEAKIYFALGEEMKRIGVEEAKLGAEFANRWNSVNRRYTAADMAEKLAEVGRGKDITNRTQGLSELVGKYGGGGVGTAVGAAVAGAPGAVIGGVVGTSMGFIKEHLVRKYGDQAVASVMRRTAQNGGNILQAAGELARQHMGDAVTSFVTRAAQRGAVVAGRAAKGAELLATKASLTDAEKKASQQGSLAKRYTAARAAALKAADPATQQQVSQALTVAAPGGTGQAAASVANRGALHKVKKIPKHPIAANTLQPHLDESLPSAAEMSRFVRVAAVVDDPTVLFDSLRRGDLTHDEVDTAREVYPEMYAELQQTVLTAVSQLDKPLPYDKALSLGLLVGVPAHPSMTPEYIAAQQAALTAPPEQGQPPAAARRPSNLSRNYDLSTEEA